MIPGICNKNMQDFFFLKTSNSREAQNRWQHKTADNFRNYENIINEICKLILAWIEIMFFLNNILNVYWVIAGRKFINIFSIVIFHSNTVNLWNFCKWPSIANVMAFHLNFSVSSIRPTINSLRYDEELAASILH